MVRRHAVAADGQGPGGSCLCRHDPPGAERLRTQAGWEAAAWARMPIRSTGRCLR